MRGNDKLIVGNYDDGIHVLNIDDAFVGKTSGPLALKCMQVSPRAVHTLGQSDAAVLYEPLSDRYARYCKDLYGFAPRVFAPSRRYTNLTEGLSLLRFVLEDPELLRELSREGARHSWHLSPFIANPLVFDLSRATGLPVSGMQEEVVRAGRVVELNDKAEFQKAGVRFGIPLPPSRHVLGWDELACESARIMARDGQVFLRRSRAAGGLGNARIQASEMHGRNMREHLEHVLTPHDEWGREVVLVEPVLSIVSSPSVLAHVDGEEIRIVGVIDQVLKDQAYIGGNYPSDEPPAVQVKLIEWFKRYLREHFIPRGGQGWVDADFGRCTDGSLVAFESNARTTGNNHGLAVRERLFGERSQRIHTWTNDALKVPAGTTFEQVLEELSDTVLWHPEREDGVVITIPPGGTGDKLSMGYVALAHTNERKLELRDAMDAFARASWARRSVAA